MCLVSTTAVPLSSTIHPHLPSTLYPLPSPGAAPVGHPTPVSPTHGRAAAHARARLESVDEKHTVEEGQGFDSTASKGGVAASASASTSAAAQGDGGGDTVDPPHVHMDAMAFGMGCCCLQVTFQVGAQGAGAGLSHVVSCDVIFCVVSQILASRHVMSWDGWMLVGDEQNRGVGDKTLLVMGHAKTADILKRFLSK